MTQAFTVESAMLRKAAAAARSIVSTSKAIPILNNVRLDAGDGQLRLLTTDQDCWAEITMPAVTSAPVSTTVAAALLDDIARNAPSGAQVEISITDAGAVAKAGRARFRLPTLSPDMFPPMNDHGLVAQVRIWVSDLLTAIGAVAHIKADDNKPHLQGVLFRPVGGGIEFATFDGKRLSRATADAQVDPGFEALTMPAPVVAKLRTILEGAGDEISIGHNGRLALIEGKGLRFLTRLCEGQFTPYWTRLPELNGEPVLFSAKDLLSAVDNLRRALDAIAIIAVSPLILPPTIWRSASRTRRLATSARLCRSPMPERRSKSGSTFATSAMLFSSAPTTKPRCISTPRALLTSFPVPPARRAT